MKGKSINDRRKDAPGGRKATDYEVDRRVEECATLLAAGKSKYEIHHLFKSRYHLCWSVVDTIYIHRARELLRKQSQMSRGEAKTLVTSRLWKILTGGSERGQLRALDLWVKIFGLADPTRIEVSGPDQGPVVTADASSEPKLSRERLLELVLGSRQAQDAKAVAETNGESRE